ncbi:MAG: hypothetical protein K2Y32_08255 [Candidatus Obscuribacterales bacterium]|nr:hypothetical protein [Candidatus Obscuribacterales bacterium]
MKSKTRHLPLAVLAALSLNLASLPALAQVTNQVPPEQENQSGQGFFDNSGNLFMEDVTPEKKAKPKTLPIDLSRVGVSTNEHGRIIPLKDDTPGGVKPFTNKLETSFQALPNAWQINPIFPVAPGFTSPYSYGYGIPFGAPPLGYAVTPSYRGLAERFGGNAYTGYSPYGIGPYGTGNFIPNPMYYGYTPGYGTYSPYGIMPYGNYAPYGAYTPYGAYSPYGAMAPYGGTALNFRLGNFGGSLFSPAQAPYTQSMWRSFNLAF